MAEFEQLYVHGVYKEIAKPFDDTRFCHWNAVRDFLDSMPSGAFILDNGCGNGKYLQYRPDIVIVGNDMCTELLEIAKNKSDVTRSNGLALPYRKGIFDAVICVAVFHHLSDVERRRHFLAEMVRVLKPGGKCLVTVWAQGQTHKRVRYWNVLENGDAMIPWKDKKGVIMSLRYYHLFTEAELRSYVTPEMGAVIISCHYEFDNWCIIIEKIG